MHSQRRKTKCCLIAIGAVLLALLAQPALAAPVTWTGATNNQWKVPTNWDTGTVPTTGDTPVFVIANQTVVYNNPVNPALGIVYFDGTGGGPLTLSQSGSYALTADTEVVGNDNKATYNQSAGSNTINNALIIGNNFPNGNGTYNKSGGSLSAGAIVVGNAGTGTFKQSSGTVNVGSFLFNAPDPFSLIVGNLNTGIGAYTMNSGILNVGAGEVVGNSGKGTFTQSSGNQTIAGGLVVGNQTGSTGNFTMSSGTLKVGLDEIIGDRGVGTFKQSSGSHTIGGGLFVGNNPGSTGSSFTMSSGSLSVAGGLFVASEGSTATFTQTSGSNTVGGDFVLGRLPGTDGTYTMTSGSLLVKGPAGEYIGLAGTGTFNQTSGSNTANKNIFIAQGNNSKGTYNLNSGSVTAKFSPPFDATADIINYGAAFPAPSGLGTFNVTGTATVTGDFLNFGNVKTTGADVTWNGNFVNHNVYTSDPSTQTFNNDFQNTTTGYVVATHSQDLFIVKGDFINNSTEIPLWDTDNARLRFAKGGVGNDTIHDFYVAGQTPTGTDNFAWRLLNITNQEIHLKDGNATPGGDQWLEVLTGAEAPSFTSGATLTNIFNSSTSPINLYYNKNLTANDYLNDFNYIIPADPAVLGAVPGALIAHTPVPPSVLLLGSGLLGLGALGWRRKRKGV